MPAPQTDAAPRAAVPVSISGNSSSSLFAALGLPVDRLSPALVSALTFFSLPLDSSLLAALRRDVLRAAVSETAANNGDVPPKAAADCVSPAGSEAFALAAASVADKGVNLEAPALAEYAAAIDPDSGGRGQNGEKKDRRRGGKDGEAETPDIASPVWLKEQFLKAAEQNSMLNILNYIPGKNGQRWIVLPFNFSEKGGEYFAALRIMLDTADQGRQICVRRLAFDIAGKGGAAEGRWLFVMEAAGGAAHSLKLLLRPKRSPQALDRLRRKLASALGIPAERVFAENSDTFPLVPDSGELSLDGINEVV
jgi:hypothetical protein